MPRIRLLLVDDHVLFREGLSRLLASEPDCDVVGACGSSTEALQILKSTKVDVVLLDYDLNQDRGAQLIAAAHRAGFTGKILMVTAGMSAKESSGVLKFGVSGIILKHNPPGSLATRRTRPPQTSALPTGNGRCCKAFLKAWPTRKLPPAWESQKGRSSRACSSYSRRHTSEPAASSFAWPWRVHWA